MGGGRGALPRPRTHICSCTQTLMHTCTRARTHAHACMRVCTHAHAHTCTHTHTNAFMHTFPRTCTHSCVHCICGCGLPDRVDRGHTHPFQQAVPRRGLYSYGQYSYGLCSYGLCNCGRYSHGLPDRVDRGHGHPVQQAVPRRALLRLPHALLPPPPPAHGRPCHHAPAGVSAKGALGVPEKIRRHLSCNAGGRACAHDMRLLFFCSQFVEYLCLKRFAAEPSLPASIDAPCVTSSMRGAEPCLADADAACTEPSLADATDEVRAELGRSSVGEAGAFAAARPSGTERAEPSSSAGADRCAPGVVAHAYLKFVGRNQCVYGRPPDLRGSASVAGGGT